MPPEQAICKASPDAVTRSTKRQWVKGVSGNPGPSPEFARRTVNRQFLLDMALVWRESGLKALRQCAKEQPASFCKLYALLVPREMKIEHSTGIKGLSDEELERMLEAVKAVTAKPVLDLSAGADTGTTTASTDSP